MDRARKQDLTLFVAFLGAVLVFFAPGMARGGGVSTVVVSPLDALPDPTIRAEVLAAAERAAMELPALRLSYVDVRPDGASPLRRVHGTGRVDAYEVGATDLKALLTDLARRYSVIMLIGTERVPIVDELARVRPATRFITIDGRFLDPLPGTGNVRQQWFRDEQAAFLAGAAAGLNSRQGTVGFIGSPRFRHGGLAAGYTAGARYVAPSVRVLVDYVGLDLEVERSVAKWAQVAQAQYRLGADVVFAAGAPTLEGVLRSAEAAGGRVVGLGGPRSQLLVPETRRARLLTMIVKDYERAVYENLRMIARGHFGAEHSWYGVPLGITVLPPVDPRLRRVLEVVASGAIRVPYDAESLDRFLRRPPPPP